MARYLAFTTKSNATVIVEATELPVKGFHEAGTEELMKQVDTAQALSSLHGSAEAIVDVLSSLPKPPDEVEVTFGLKASAELDTLVVAKASGEATFTVRMVWRNPHAR